MTLTRGSRPLLIALVWLGLTTLQAVSLALAGDGVADLGVLLVFHGAIGLTWAALTFVVGTWMLPDNADRLPARVFRHALGLLICGLLDTLIRRVAATVLGSTPAIPWYGTLLYFADRTAVGYIAIVLVTRTLEAHDRFVARQQQSLSLQAELARARLASLEEQLHPHFLFNCLGAVSELAHEAPAAAARMLRQLASVLRFAIDRTGTEVTVAEELAALDCYMEVQRTRFSDWLTIDARLAPDAADLLMPPLVLQPLVENAIRHGLQHRDAPGAIVVSARTADDRLILEVHDNGVGLRGAPLGGRGIGTSNVRERLAALYGDEARLLVYEDASGGVISQVNIPAHQRPDASALLESAEGESVVTSLFRRWPVGSIAVAWAAWGLLWTQQSIVYLAFRGRLGDRSLLEIAGQDFLLTMLWAALTPLMLLMMRLVPITRRHLGLRIAAHAAVAMALGAAHEWAAQKFLSVTPAITNESIAATAWGILAYAVVLGAAHYGRIHGWLRDRELADANLRVSIAEAELEETYTRTRPRQLLDRLEEIAESIQRDAASAETQLARLGDQLRESLEERVPA